MQQELNCKGKIDLGTLPPETTKRLQDFAGNWLEFAPGENAVVVRHVQPVGCPALSAIPCELLSMIGSMPAHERDAMPGGAFYFQDQHGEVMRLLVNQGEVRIQWPHPDYRRATPVAPEVAMENINPCEAKINGWARFPGSSADVEELQDYLDRYEGLYPEGEIVPDFTPDAVSVTFKDVNVGPQELIDRLKILAKSEKKLQAELDITSFVPDSEAQDFRVHIHNGTLKTERPSLWSGE